MEVCWNDGVGFVLQGDFTVHFEIFESGSTNNAFFSVRYI